MRGDQVVGDRVHHPAHGGEVLGADQVDEVVAHAGTAVDSVDTVVAHAEAAVGAVQAVVAHAETAVDRVDEGSASPDESWKTFLADVASLQ